MTVSGLLREAWPLVDHKRYRKKVQGLACQALDIDPHSVDALAILALAAEKRAERIAWARRAMEAGAKRFKKMIVPNGPTSHTAERLLLGYQWAARVLALELHEGQNPEDAEEAISIAEDIVGNFAKDQLEFRYLLVKWHAEARDWERGKDLAYEMAGDLAADGVWWALLYMIELEDPGADALAASATAANRYVAELLARRTPPEKPSDRAWSSLGSAGEAAAYAAFAHRAWRASSTAMDKLPYLRRLSQTSQRPRVHPLH